MRKDTLGIADAYCHVGRPRFGSAQEAIEMWDRNGIERGVLVLGPGVPALDDLAEGMSRYRDRVRGIGIPFGSTPERRLESVRLALDAGAIGCRIDSREARENPDVLELLGERGLWAYGIGPCRSAEQASLYLGWLERHPKARLASPHFVEATPLDLSGSQGNTFKNLLSHPRFFPILSRQGAASAETYPYRDLIRWVEQILEYVPFDRLLWGSEYPVLYWRDETPKLCRTWLGDLVPSLDEQRLAAFQRENTVRLFFSEPAPPARKLKAPDWIEQEFDRNRHVQLLPRTTLDVRMPAYQVFLSDFLKRRAAGENELLFGAYLAEKLEECAGELRTRSR